MQWGTAAPWGMQFSSIVAAGLNCITFLFAFFVLPETLNKNEGAAQPREGRGFQNMLTALKHRQIGPLMYVFLFVSFSMALMEVMLFVFVHDRFGWSQTTAGYAFAYIGVIMVMTQGYFIRRWIPKFGEKNVLLVGLVAMAIGFLAIGPSHSVGSLAVAMTILAVGNGCMRPPIMGIVSILADEDQQGLVMGVMQSMASVGRILGPPLGGWLYQELSDSAPFFVAGILTTGALLLYWPLFGKIPRTQKPVVTG